MKALLGCLLAAALLLVPRAASSADLAAAPPDAAATLQLAGGDFVAGQLHDSAQPGILSWQGSDFVQPFRFPLDNVTAVQFPQAPQRPKPGGQYCVELHSGGVLFGSLAGLSAQEAQLDVAGLGLLHLARPAIRRILHWRAGADPVYVGPNGLSEWDEASPAGAWQQEGGQLTTEKSGASLFADLGIPAQASIEFELSWTFQPDFLFALATSREETDQAFRFEIWDRQIVLVRETKTEADVASLQNHNARTGRCHFLVYLDQPHNRATVYSADGARLAEVGVSEPGSQPRRGLQLVNYRGNVRLEQLRIAPWNGQLPQPGNAGQSRLHRTDGAVVYGEIKALDPSTNEFLVPSSSGETRLPADAVESIVLSPSGGSPACDVRAVLRDGARLAGNLAKIENGRVWLDCPGVVDPLRVPFSQLQTILVLRDPKFPAEPKGRSGRLQTDNLRLQGCLVEAVQQPDASCLVWHPRGSTTASPLKHGVSGRIIYREPPARSPSAQPTRTSRVLQPQPAGAAFVGPVVRMLAPNQPGPATSTSSSTRWPGPTLYLRTGDTIPCDLQRIDQHGLTFHSSLVDVTSVTHDKVKAIELENQSRSTKIDTFKRDRLLTLPRMQKDDPPTHLIRSTEGDYLRARLIELDDKTATVEVRLETRRLPRDQIARIIWLDKMPPKTAEKGEEKKAEKDAGKSTDSTSEKKADHDVEKPATTAGPDPAAHSKPAAATRVQILRGDGIRLTFLAEKLSDMTLQGTSDVLGSCRVQLSQLDQILLGKTIDQTVETLPFQRWKLQPATEPKFASADSAQAGGSPGTESPLVGKPAPEVELDMLNGKPFRLGSLRGKVVVLEFWATWCGPCIQTLPEVVRVVRELQDPNLMLVAVNLEEDPKTVTSMLQRLKLDVAVALDPNGIAGHKYSATAIPQSVIVDRQGNVARVFVGSGPQYPDQLRQAIQSALNPDRKPATPADQKPPAEPGPK